MCRKLHRRYQFSCLHWYEKYDVLECSGPAFHGKDTPRCVDIKLTTEKTLKRLKDAFEHCPRDKGSYKIEILHD
ncbi:hypothetical protein IMZ48_06380 [Candidatus Bathyarchaeota archaeon]|nr:hypothetical protein [Candidatus Bathyarchaeota archaeon]